MNFQLFSLHHPHFITRFVGWTNHFLHNRFRREYLIGFLWRNIVKDILLYLWVKIVGQPLAQSHKLAHGIIEHHLVEEMTWMPFEELYTFFVSLYIDSMSFYVIHQHYKYNVLLRKGNQKNWAHRLIGLISLQNYIPRSFQASLRLKGNL